MMTEKAQPNTGPNTGSNTGPVSARARIENLDVVRGVAILGIFMVNIWVFAMPETVYEKPNIMGPIMGADAQAWWLTTVFFQWKFITLFSMLFGAGIVLMAGETREPSADARHKRRMLWLLLFGFLHMFFIWFGDILLLYAIAGLLAAKWRGMGVKKLIWVGLALILATNFIFSVLPMALNLAPADVLDGIQTQISEEHNKTVAAALAAYQGDYSDQILYRFKTMPVFLLFEVFIFGPRVLGLMFIGMAFIKTGVLQGKKPLWLYVAMVLVGAFALYLSHGRAQHDLASGFAFPDYMANAMIVHANASLFVAMGYMALIVLTGKIAALKWLRFPFACAGRMAFSLYIAQSLIGTTLFYGWGFGGFGETSFAEQQQIVWKVWLGLLVWAVLWLQFFRFGPLEWVWRSLTYGKIDPLLKRNSRG